MLPLIARATLLAAAAIGTAAPTRAAGRTVPDRIVRVALAARDDRLALSATGPWRVAIDSGRRPFVSGTGGEAWRVERRGNRLRLAGGDGDATPWRMGPFVVRPAATGALLRVAGTRYRGELWLTATDTGILVVNALPVEDYLRGVVPLELPTRALSDLAALEAQAIAARSYTMVRVPPSAAAADARSWHLTATVQHQRYGGAEAEHAVVDRAIAATAGLVLRFGSTVVDAPYFASCGGRTAAPREAWTDWGERVPPYLASVDDRDPRTGRPYCDLSPRNHWTAVLGAEELTGLVRRHLASRGSRDPRGAMVLDVTVPERFASGRVGVLELRTSRGAVRIGAPAIRTSVRDVRGAPLASTYFSIVREAQSGGRLTEVTLEGAGNGHGVGMCQWGAIGRARAGADARAILQHYYPGTLVGFAE